MPVHTLPSGMKIEFEELGVEAEDLIAEANESTDPAVRDSIDERLMGVAWLKTVTQGPTAHDADGRPVWNKMLLGDKVGFIYQIIVESWGGDLRLKARCARKHDESYVLDLGRLEVNRLSDDVAKAVRAGKPLEVRLPSSGRLVYWSPVTVERARQVALDSEDFPGQGSTNNLISRIVGVEGFDPQTGLDPDTKWDIREFTRKLKGKDAVALRQEFEAKECGIDNVAQKPCPHTGCGLPVLINLGEATPDFLSMRAAVKH